MTDTDIIELPLFDLKYDKVTEHLVHSLELLDTSLVYCFEAYIDKYPTEEDEADGWISVKEGVYQKIRLQVLKRSINAFESSWMEKEEDGSGGYWTLVIVYGVNDDNIRLKFKLEKELREVENKLMLWLV